MTNRVHLASLLAAAGATATLAGSVAAQVQPNAGMLRWPDVGRTQICFVYANDIWMVPKQGGVATPVASPQGQESFPRFSPDESTIAFVGNYEGGRDLYTVPVSGGVATRVTYHPMAETLCDWSPQGGLIFMGNGLAGLSRQSQLLWTSAAGGLPSKLPVPYAGFGSISPDGQWLAYTPHSTDNRTWKRYRGGMATDIWLFNLRDNSAKKITDWEGTDTLPMWVPGGDGKVLYYLSDNGPEHRLNIWKYDVASGARTQVTQYKDYDVRWPSIGPGNGKGEIVFQYGAELRLLDLASGKDSVVKVTIPGDRPSVRPRAVDASETIGGAGISPSGKRVVVEGRGDIWTVPAKEGITRNLTRSAGVFERDPAWSPDGKWIAYFSDESGEYELWVRSSDAKPPEEKKDDKAEAKKDDDKPDADKKESAKAAEPKAEPKPAPVAPRKLTTLGPGFRYSPVWSPDSKHIAFTDKAGGLHLVNVETGELKTIATDPWAGTPTVSWSHDSNWIAYDLADPNTTNGGIWLYNVKEGKATQVVSQMFSCANPAFDSKGDWLFFKSRRAVGSPIYSDLDGTYVYTNNEVLMAAPLRADVKNPWAPKVDEESFKKDEPKKDDKKDEAKKDDAKKPDQPKDDKPAETAAADDGVTGTWVGTANGAGEGIPATGIPFTFMLKLGADGTLTGTTVSAMGQGTISGGSYNKDNGSFTLTISMGDTVANVEGTLKDGELDAKWQAGDSKGTMTAKRKAKKSGDASEQSGDADTKAKDEAKKEVKIDLDGFERRAITLPVAPGSFGRVAGLDGKLIYVRGETRGAAGPGGIKLFDLSDDTKEEKSVTAGNGFTLSADDKKLLVFRGRSLTICDASAGGGKSAAVPTDAMKTTIDPRVEWRQIFNDAWRLERDFFYEPTMHGVNWEEMRKRYGAMIEDCANREDVAWVLAELISELNIGHAYVTSPGDVEAPPRAVSIGMLGADYELVTQDGASAYRISRILDGGQWDTDARSPLLDQGLNVKPGEFLLAVNGVPVDTSKDPWAAFVGTAGKVTSVTVSAKPAMDGTEREVLVTPISSETGLRYRAWVEAKRKYVEEKSGGKIGYIYVPNTGVDGQDELYRQFFGQRGMDALIIDDRWNGGGQIPNRFIELLNRPVLNFWARRDGKDWVWPPDGHAGPKAMLINGLAGSGGDMFPALFRQVKLGKLIGTRTWGGLVGITGDPDLIDGGSITVPRFAYYEKDGTWGIEGHGVDPDIEVIDDPSLRLSGGDPQIDKAVEVLLAEIQTNPAPAPRRPASPDRSGMGIKPEDK
ncbi:MAG: S41 family peptidase [Phycisphaerales bacterium]